MEVTRKKRKHLRMRQHILIYDTGSKTEYLFVLFLFFLPNFTKGFRVLGFANTKKSNPVPVNVTL